MRESSSAFVVTPGSRLRWSLALAICAWWPAHAGDIFDRSRFLALARSVVKVEVITADGAYSIGTAVAIAPGLFVTNCHVTRDARVATLLRGGARWPATSEFADLFLDLCVLDVPGLRDVSPVSLGSARAARRGDPVAAVGFTGGVGLQARTGVVRALHAMNDSVVLQTTTPFTSGASGGALFDSDGRLIGVLTFRLRGAEGYYFAAPVDWIVDRLADRSAFVDVAPLKGPKPFWAQPTGSLPYFMQAASLEVDREWGRLVALTDAWSEADKDNAEPWYLRGTGDAALGALDEAVADYRTAVRLDPRFGVAWFDLGVLYLRLGATDDARRVLAVLRDVDPVLADRLAAQGRPAMGAEPGEAVPGRTDVR